MSANYIPLFGAILAFIVCIAAIIAAFFRFTVPGYMPDDDLEELGEWDDLTGKPLNEYAAEADRRKAQTTDTMEASNGRETI